MASISIPGLNSKYGTQEMVKNLVAVEKKKLTSLEKNKETLESDKKLWQEVNRKFTDLRTSSKKLYSFENSFNNKKALSSNESILTAKASKKTDIQELEFKVLQTASSDKIMSPSLSTKLKVPKGDYEFQVGEKSFTLHYRGGKLSDFANKLENKTDGAIKTTVVKDTSSSQIILFETKETGINNRLQFKNDALKWALNKNILKAKEDSNTKIDIPKAISQLPKTEKILFNDKKLSLSPKTKITIPTNISIKDGMMIHYKISYKDLPIPPKAEEPPLPDLPQTPSGIYQSLEISSFPSSAEVPPWEAPPTPPIIKESLFGSYQTNSGYRNLPEFQSENSQEVNIPLIQADQKISEIILENKNSNRDIYIADLKIIDPSVKDGYTPTNAISQARNAIVEFSGIPIERESNSIDDLVSGLTLKLNKADKNELVNLKIEPDSEAAKNDIIQFVFDYNQAMTEILILTSDNSEIINEIKYFTDEERTEAKEKQGTFRSDLTLSQVKTRLQRATSSPYPTSLEEKLSLLSQIGISTNATGAGGGYDASKLRGYLEINEETLDEVLNEHSPVVKELFGMDTDGDLIIDSGAGYEIDNYIKYYSQSGGIIPGKITLVDSKIKAQDKKISDYKEYLDEYEQDLKVKYGNMEQTLNQLEKSSSSLDSLNRKSEN